jgi:hypothetical protein
MTCNMPASFWVLQPQLMHDYLEHEACSYPTGCASMSGTYFMRQGAAVAYMQFWAVGTTQSP